MKSCSNCQNGKNACLNYDKNPYYQEWMGRCNHPVAKIMKGNDQGLMDPSDYNQPNQCPFFRKMSVWNHLRGMVKKQKQQELASKKVDKWGKAVMNYAHGVGEWNRNNPELARQISRSVE